MSSVVDQLINQKMLKYFGTNLDSAGHYIWELNYDQFGRSTLGIEKYPFYLESLPYNNGNYSPNGTVEFSRCFGFTICAIAGSCIDTRRGCRSVFFVQAVISDEEMKKMIFETPIAKKIIDKMPFEVKW